MSCLGYESFSLATPFKLESDRLEQGTSINVLYGEYGSLRIMRSFA